MQWRSRFPTDLTDSKNLVKLIQKRLDAFFAEFGKIEVTEKEYYSVQGQLEKYAPIIHTDEKTVWWKINALEQIGVTEPFSKPAIIDMMLTPEDEMEEADQGGKNQPENQDEPSQEEEWEEAERPDYLFFPMTPDEDLYKPSRMRDADCSPKCIFLPTNLTLFNMIRACHGVKEVEELWFCKRLYKVD